MTTDNEFDRLLHDALSEYRDAEPLAGTEDRVLQRLSTQGAASRQSWWRWGLVAACAAALAAAIWIASRPAAVQRPQVQQAGSEQSVIPPAKARVESPTALAKARQPIQRAATGRAVATVAEANTGVVRSRGLPAQFPTPTPLTAEERAFIASLQHTSETASGAPDGDKAITIAEIEIKPLTISGRSSGVDQ